MRGSLQTEGFPEDEFVRRGRDYSRMATRPPSYIEGFESFDLSYRPSAISYYSGDSRLHAREGTSRPRAVVRHTEYHSDAEEDFTKPYRPATFVEKPKFVARIATTPLPVNAKIPTSLGKYNEMTDPSDHLLNFVAVGGVSGWTLPYWCHMFALTLTGAAREWFEKLPDGQIQNWDDFVAKFSQHFSQQKKHTRDPSEILDVVWRNNESIDDFISRFNNENLNIGGISEDMQRGAFCKNVKSDVLIRTLTGRDGMPKTWDEIMTAAKLFARFEKTLSFENQKQTPKVEFQTPRPNIQAKGTIWSRLQPSAETSKQFDARSLISNKNKASSSARVTNNWTPLSKTPSEILTTKNVNFRKPQPLTKRSFLNPKKHSKKHCSFHDDIGHNTDVCIALKGEIEAVVKSGKLGHLFRNARPGTGKTPARGNPGLPMKQVKDLNVHMIQGGHKVGGKMREFDEEEWKNEPVIFPRVKGGPCNKNPLIITALIGHYRSHYVFFDTGSTSAIMYEHCFEQLDEDDKARLKPIHAPVSGFGGEVTHPRGVISFPVTLIDGTHSRTKDV
ncbi:uncharacterized protein LOC143535761 [Bidens hawaiensis]|uniref:uncharacterized protein LOC143535761 n=1 Tax=Bidens hawaiensis TaxID=980011 RepID=UPI00404B7C37